MEVVRTSQQKAKIMERSRNKNGRWRKKRSDAGKSRKRYEKKMKHGDKVRMREGLDLGEGVFNKHRICAECGKQGCKIAYADLRHLEDPSKNMHGPLWEYNECIHCGHVRVRDVS